MTSANAATVVHWALRLRRTKTWTVLSQYLTILPPRTWVFHVWKHSGSAAAVRVVACEYSRLSSYPAARTDQDSAKCVTYSTDLLPTNHSGKLLCQLRTNTTEQLLTTTCALQTTYWRHQQDRQTIDKPTNFTNNKPTDTGLTKDGSKSTMQ